MNTNSNHIEPELLTKYLSGDLLDEELEVVEHWIEASPENKKHISELKLIWDKSSTVSDFDLIDVEADWREVKAKFSSGDAKVLSISEGREKTFFHYFTRIAAVLVLITGIALVFYKFSNNNREEQNLVAVATGNNEEQEVQLPDGSKVFLNANSKISYVSDFSSNREVYLEGEAFFEVVKNPSSPFRVNSNHTVTEVLGTSFNVKTNSGSDNTTVTLMTGKVAFYKEDKTEKVLIEKGEQVIYSKGKITKKGTEDDNVIAWEENKLTFNNSKLSDVIADLENYFGKKIEVQNENLYNCRYTGFFPNPKFETVFEVVSVTLDAKVDKLGDTYVLSGHGCER